MPQLHGPNSAPPWSCHQNDCPMSNSHLDEQAFPVPQRKRMPVILPAQHPSLLPQPTMLPFSFEGTTLAPFSVQVGKRLGPVRTVQSLGHCDWFRGKLPMSSQPIRNNGHQPLDFGWNDGEGNTLSPGVAKWTEWKPGVIGGHLCYPKERDTEQNKANKEKIRAKKWRHIHDLFIFTPQARTFQFSHMHESREKTNKSPGSHQHFPSCFLFLLLRCRGRLQYLKVFRRPHVISSAHTLILKPALNQASVTCNQKIPA